MCSFSIVFFCVIILFPQSAIQPPEEENEQGKNVNSNCCRSTDSFSSPWVTRILFGLLNVTSSARYLIAWIAWLWPILLIFILPCLFIIFLYFTACLVQVYRLRGWLTKQMHLLWSRKRTIGPFTCNTFIPSADILRRLIAVVWDIHGRVFHGYEICGMEKLPASGPAFIVYYHGTLPLDAYYFISRHAIEKNSFPVPVVDRFMFRIPGLQYLLRISKAIVGSVDECVAILTPHLTSTEDEITSHGTPCESSTSFREPQASMGEVLLISPGGVREALFADEYYSVVWGKRRGFARIARIANKPIYPMFTENVREAIRVVQYGKQWSRRLYELTRLPFAIFYGYFPVKLRTYIGDPIYPISSETDEELSDRVREAIEDLIRLHQRTPGNLLIAFLQRIPIFDRWIKGNNRNLLADKK